MARGFIVRPLAEADLEDAARWYEEERAGLAQRFLNDVDQTFARIRERPLQFPTVGGNIHRALRIVKPSWMGTKTRPFLAARFLLTIRQRQHPATRWRQLALRTVMDRTRRADRNFGQGPDRRIACLTNQLYGVALLLIVLGSWPATAAGQSVSLKDAARALGGKASTLSDVDLPPASLPELVKTADLIVEASIVSKRTVLCFDEQMVCTEYQILPTRSFKNRLPATTRRIPGPGDPIVVRQGGGRLVEDGLELESHNNLFPVEGLSVGRSFVMFLQQRPDDEQLWFVHGPYGVFQLDGSSVLPSTEIARRHAQSLPRNTSRLYPEIARLLQQP